MLSLLLAKTTLNALPDGIVERKMINNFITKLKCAELVKFLKGHACI